MDYSVCNFIKNTDRTDEINIINFIYEKKPLENTDFFRNKYYKLLLCTYGEATILYNSNPIHISVGDIVFTFPNSNVCIVSEKDFNFIYISFDGIIVGNTLKDLTVTENNNIFYNYKECIPTCENFIKLSTPGSVYFLAKSSMLFIFANIKNKLKDSTDNKDKKLISDIKNYISNNYSDSTLSIEKIATLFSYNKNYISYIFKKETTVSIVKYINDVRINSACALAGKITSVKDIAYMCGYNDPLYFTRLFKQIVKMTPKEYIKQKLNSN